MASKVHFGVDVVFYFGGSFGHFGYGVLLGIPFGIDGIGVSLVLRTQIHEFCLPYAMCSCFVILGFACLV